MMAEKAKSGREAVEKLLHAYGERDIEGILDCLTEEAYWIGTAAHEHKFGKIAIKEILEQDLATDPTPYDIKILDLRELRISEDVSLLFALMQARQRGNEDVAMECRNTYTCCREADEFRVCSWHCSLATALQKEDEYFPISFAENIMKKATFDALTHIMNRASFEESVRLYLKEESEAFAFILIDLDNFKIVNDRFGHQAGDVVLIHAAERLKKTFGKNDIVARLGGDEFVAFAPAVSPQEVEEKISSFIQELSKPIYFNAQSNYIPSASVGVYFCEKGEGTEYEQCYQAADAAMYQAKNGGKSTWYINRG